MLKLKRAYLIVAYETKARAFWSAYIDNGEGLKIVWPYPTEKNQEADDVAHTEGFLISGIQNWNCPKYIVGKGDIFDAGQRLKIILKNKGYDIIDCEISSLTGYQPSTYRINQPYLD